MKDIDTQVEFVAGAMNRILWQIDGDILSPTFGCAHPAYWRDKTSDFADMRRQEVMLPLALLYTNDYPGSFWKQDEKLKHAIEALFSFWCKNQYPDGSMDEWYKGERAFAAAAFSTHAVARTLMIMKDSLPDDTIELARKKLKNTAGWLMRRDDLFKANHQAVGVAALAWAAHVLEEDAFKENAYKKLRSILGIQRKEGWFPELGGMDVGYTFLTIEFIAMAMDLWRDWSYIEPLQRAFDFACEWVHPDLTFGSEYGICQNTYLSRIAVILMSGFSGRAAFIRQSLDRDSLGFKGYSYGLSDDLRLLRWAYQPLLAYDYNKKKSSLNLNKNEAFPLSNPIGQAFLYYDEAAMSRFSCAKGTGIFAPVAGGLARFFNPVSGNSLSDYGYAINFNGKYVTNSFYHKNVTIIKKGEDSLEVSCSVSYVKKFMPPFWARLALRIFSSTSLGSKIIRQGIDVIRKKRGTALNQSSTNLSTSKPIGTLTRKISLQSDSIIIKDKLNFKKPVNKGDIYFLESNNDNWMTCQPITLQLLGLPAQIEHLEIMKRYRAADNWSLKEVSANIIKGTSQ